MVNLSGSTQFSVDYSGELVDGLKLVGCPEIDEFHGPPHNAAPVPNFEMLLPESQAETTRTQHRQGP